MESIEERLQKHAQQGGVAESGGCTDASVRLSTLLKVCTYVSQGPCPQKSLRPGPTHLSCHKMYWVWDHPYRIVPEEGMIRTFTECSVSCHM